MLDINLFDSNFSHSFTQDGFITASMGVKPKLVNWIPKENNWDGVTVFTDHFIGKAKAVKSKWKVAWLIEPECIHKWIYSDIIKYEADFDLIYTHSSALIARNPSKYKLSLVASSRVPIDEQAIHEKSELLSIIASNKTQSVGHNLRHAVIREYGKHMDVWGSGYEWFKDKREPLQHYAFSVAIMNMSEDNYFTEVLTDCFMYGTIPIFWGCPNIGEFFNIEGLITFNKIEDLEYIIPSLNKTLYNSALGAVLENLETAKMYTSTDDMFARKLMKEFDFEI
jgi:hypothetical protein